MKLIQAILVTVWGAFIMIPSFAQEAHLRTLAATGTVQEIREALRDTSEVSKRGAGADINARSRSGETALFYAAQYNPNPEMIITLLAAGAAQEDCDALGRTALMAAAWGTSNPAVITTFLKAGADAKAKSSAGRTALDYARENPNLSPGSDGFQALEVAMK
jgi:ankyrin repeat protein